MNGRRVLPLTNGAVMGEGDVADIENVLQQRDCVHGEIAEGVLHRPAFRVVLQRRYEGKSTGGGCIRSSHPDKQQPLANGGRQARTPGATSFWFGLRVSLGDAAAMALTIKTPAVVRTLQLSGPVDPALTQRNQTVGAHIRERSPRVTAGVPPDHKIPLQQGEATGTRRIEILEISNRPPLLCPGGIHDKRVKRCHLREMSYPLSCDLNPAAPGGQPAGHRQHLLRL